MLFKKKLSVLLIVSLLIGSIFSTMPTFADVDPDDIEDVWEEEEYDEEDEEYDDNYSWNEGNAADAFTGFSADEMHVWAETKETEAGATGPVVEEFMKYKDDKILAPGSLSEDIDLDNVGKGLFYDGENYYFFTDTGIRASNIMYTIQGDRFYFNEDGRMVRNELIEYNGELYYFDYNGAMYKNRWYTAEEVDTSDNSITYTSYFFGPTGRAYRAVDNSIVLKTIDDDKYGFNEDGEKLEGYYSLDGTKLDPDEDPAYADCMYYFDPQEGGAAAAGWSYYNGSTRGDEYDDNDEIVLYFDEKTRRKVYSKDSDKCVYRTIEGQRYAFDNNGVRRNKWYTSDPLRPSTRSNTKYFDPDFDGFLQKGWFIAIPPENAYRAENRRKHENNEEAWYYAMTNGSIVKNCVRKIGKYYYAFDQDGVMQEDAMVKARGSQFVDSYQLEHLNRDNLLLDPAEYGYAVRGSIDEQFPAGKGLLDAASGERWMYFMGIYEDSEGNEVDSKEGAMANLNTQVQIELADSDVYLIASSVGGYARVGQLEDTTHVTEVLERSGKLIQNGILLKPDKDENNYGIVKFRVSRLPSNESGGGYQYLDYENITRVSDDSIFSYRVVNSSGALVGGDGKNAKCIKDKSGNYIYIAPNGEFIGCYSEEGRFSNAKTPLASDSTTYYYTGNQKIWWHKEDKEWKKGLPDKSLRVDPEYLFLNFSAKDKNGLSNSPYDEKTGKPNGYASLVYNTDNPAVGFSGN